MANVFKRLQARIRAGVGLPADDAGTRRKLFQLTPMGTAQYNTDRTIAAQKEMAEYGYQKDLEMWNRSNEYNNPVSQMNRLQEAGLNPNMVYGTGTVGNAAGPGPRFSAPQLSYDYAPLSAPRVLSQFQDFRMRQAQIENVRANTVSTLGFKNPNIGARTKMVESQMGLGSTPLALLNRGTKDYVFGPGAGLFSHQKDFAEARARNEKARGENLSADLLWKMFQNQWAAAGITSRDHIAFRSLVRAWNEAGLSMDELYKAGMSFRKKR